MSLDGAFLHFIKEEFTPVIGARVEKIIQPSKDEVIFNFRGQGRSFRVIFSANAKNARVCFFNGTAENLKQPTMFHTILRKRLNGARLAKIEQDGLERILNFEFLCTNEIGDRTANIFTAEIMGRNSNLILRSKPGETAPVSRIADSAKRVTDEISSVRRVLPNAEYFAPIKEKRIVLRNFSFGEVIERLTEIAAAKPEERLCNAIIGVFEGVSPVFAREVSFFCNGDAYITIRNIIGSDNLTAKLEYYLLNAQKILNNEKNPEFTMVSRKDGTPADFSFVRISQYGEETITKTFPDANALLQNFFDDSALLEREQRKKEHLIKTVKTAFERVSRKISARKDEISACKTREKFRVYGDLITANLYKSSRLRNANALSAENYENGEVVEIPLDKRLSLSQNAQKYYNEYKKLAAAETKLQQLIKSGEQELAYLDSVFDAINRISSNTEDELAEIRQELTETGYIRGNLCKNKNPQPKTQPPLRIVTKSGFAVLVGKNNIQNDKITKSARPRDIWFHVKNMPGSHVILLCNGEKPDDDCIAETAGIAARYSKANKNGTFSRVPVDYCEARFVKKPAGAKPGMVIFTDNKTIIVSG